MPGRIALPENTPVAPNTGRIARFMRRRYAPFLLKPVVKGFVLLSFTGLFVGSIISMQHINLGLSMSFVRPLLSDKLTGDVLQIKDLLFRPTRI